MASCDLTVADNVPTVLHDSVSVNGQVEVVHGRVCSSAPARLEVLAGNT